MKIIKNKPLSDTGAWVSAFGVEIEDEWRSSVRSGPVLFYCGLLSFLSCSARSRSSSGSIMSGVSC